MHAVEDSKPEHAVVREFGAVAALFDIATQLRLVEHIDRHVPKRSGEVSVGTYLLTASLNRCVAPCSKASIGNWFEATILPHWLDVRPRQLTSRRFRDNMDRTPENTIADIERDIAATKIDRFAVDLRQVLFDATNFFTFIDSFIDRAPFAQRGHSREGRKSLRIVGLAVLVVADNRLPLLHSVYPGNQPDAPTFSSLLDALTVRLRELFARRGEDFTLIFDKGNNSVVNLAALDEGPYRFVGSLVPSAPNCWKSSTADCNNSTGSKACVSGEPGTLSTTPSAPSGSPGTGICSMHRPPPCSARSPGAASACANCKRGCAGAARARPARDGRQTSKARGRK